MDTIRFQVNYIFDTIEYNFFQYKDIRHKVDKDILKLYRLYNSTAVSV